jgi:hypothetical protein
MSTIDLSAITVPSPAAFNAENPTQQMENLAYVKLQIYALMKAASFIQSDTSKSLEDVVNELADLAISVDIGGVILHVGHHVIYTTHEP